MENLRERREGWFSSDGHNMGVAGLCLRDYYIIHAYTPSNTASDFSVLTTTYIDFDAETFEKRENDEM